MLIPKDGTKDIQMKWNESFPVYWHYKFADVEKKGSFTGLFLDDPRYPTLSSSAKMLGWVFSTASLALLSQI
jgi:hypothetical protein